MHPTQREQSEEELRQALELGWRDIEAGRVRDFDPEAVKQRGRARLALTKQIGETSKTPVT